MLKPYIRFSICIRFSCTGESREPISRTYEDVGDFCVYPNFERLFGPLRSHDLLFRRHTGECAVHP